MSREIFSGWCVKIETKNKIKKSVNDEIFHLSFYLPRTALSWLEKMVREIGSSGKSLQALYNIFLGSLPRRLADLANGYANTDPIRWTRQAHKPSYPTKGLSLHDCIPAVPMPVCIPNTTSRYLVEISEIRIKSRRC